MESSIGGGGLGTFSESERRRAVEEKRRGLRAVLAAAFALSANIVDDVGARDCSELYSKAGSVATGRVNLRFSIVSTWGLDHNDREKSCFDFGRSAHASTPLDLDRPIQSLELEKMIDYEEYSSNM